MVTSTKIVFIITGLDTGGAEMMLIKLLSNIDPKKFNPVVISLTNSGELGHKIEALGYPVISLDLRYNLSMLSTFKKLIRLLKDFKPDVVNTWMYHADLFGGLAARLAGIKVVIWSIRNSDLTPGKTKKSTIKVAKLCAILSRYIPLKVISCSERARLIHISEGYSKEKILVIPNGFDLSSFKHDSDAKISIREELGLSFDSIIVGLIARYDPQKNHSGFIEVAKLVNGSFPEANFLLAGVDNNNQEIVKMIDEAKLSRNFHLLGVRNDMPQIMSSLDILVSSSHGEGFPNVLGEAMACCVPCVVTDVGDCADIVGDTGFVVKPDDMTTMANHIIEILNQPDLKSNLGRKARRRVTERYEIKNIALEYQNLFFSLTQEV